MFHMWIGVRHDVPRWGGARRGAGRPAKGPRASERHGVRPAVSRHHPVLVTARTRSGLARTLGRGGIYRAIRRAIRLSLARSDFRIVELGLRGGALELLVEARDRIALARGMQGFQVCAARALNRAADTRGNVFVDRYAPAQLATVSDVRRALVRMAPVTVAWPCWPETWLLMRVMAPMPRGMSP